MWENIIQSIRKVKSGDKGLGCILAHTMGLGKTFQVLTVLCLFLLIIPFPLHENFLQNKKGRAYQTCPCAMAE